METGLEIQNQLMPIWKDVFKDKKIEPYYNFFELGGTSLELTRMLLLVNKAMNVNISLPKFFVLPTIEGLAYEIKKQRKKKDSGTFDLADAISEAQCEAQLNDVIQDSHLDISIQKQSILAKTIENARAVFLTGATGFLGAHLLAELSKQTSCCIYCLVREQSDNMALEKLYHCLRTFGLSASWSGDRIIPVCGDLGKPNFGLPQETYKMLCEKVDILYHCGANVHHIYTYEQLRNENALSTAECIRMAATGQPKQLHYISTASCVSRFDENGNGLESEPSEIPPNGFGGYELSKWVSERLLCKAAQQGLFVRIFRPGNITGHSQTGMCVPQFNHALLFAKGCMQMGAAPDLKMKLEMTPVDILSKAIITLSARNSLQTIIFNMSNPNEMTWKQYFGLFSEKGVPVKMLPYKEWRENHLLNIDETNALFPVMTVYGEDEVFYPSCCCTLAQKALQGTPVQYPHRYDALVETYYKFLTDNGFFNFKTLMETKYEK